MATFDAFALAAAITATDRAHRADGRAARGRRCATRWRWRWGWRALRQSAAATVHLAIGASSPVVVERWHGRPWRRTAAHIRETAEALRPLLAGEKAEFDGELVRTHGYRLRLPAPATSLTIAAFGDAAVRVAARLADRMVINLCTPAVAGRLRERLDHLPVRPASRTAARCLGRGRRRSERRGDRAAQPRCGRLSGGARLRRDVRRRRLRRAGRRAHVGARRPGAAGGVPPELCRARSGWWAPRRRSAGASPSTAPPASTRSRSSRRRPAIPAAGARSRRSRLRPRLIVRFASFTLPGDVLGRDRDLRADPLASSHGPLRGPQSLLRQRKRSFTSLPMTALLETFLKW